jgi:hypothetical protein
VVQLQFYCEGTIASWGNPLATKTQAVAVSTLPSYYAPIYLRSTVGSLEMVTSIPAKVTEGDPFATQPQVKVLDAAGKPVAGKKVFALMSKAAGGFILPYGVLRQDIYDGRYASLKRVTNPISKVTGTDGIATFEKLGFQVGGPVGNHAVRFVCDGVQFPGDKRDNDVAVQTRVAKVLLKTLTPGLVVHANVRGQQGRRKSTHVTLEVVDQNGRGVVGKTATLNTWFRAVNSTDYIPYDDKIRVAVGASVRDERVAVTGNDGFLHLPISITRMPAMDPKGTIYIQYTVDGVKSHMSPSINPVRSPELAYPITSVCSDIEVNISTMGKVNPKTGNPLVYVGSADGYVMSVQLNDQNGQPMQGQRVLRYRERSYVNRAGTTSMYTPSTLSCSDACSSSPHVCCDATSTGQNNAGIPEPDAACLLRYPDIKGSGKCMTPTGPEPIECYHCPSGTTSDPTDEIMGRWNDAIAKEPEPTGYGSAYGLGGFAKPLFGSQAKTRYVGLTQETGKSFTMSTLVKAPREGTFAVRFESYLCDNLNLQFLNMPAGSLSVSARKAMCVAAGCAPQQRVVGKVGSTTDPVRSEWWCDLTGVEDTATRCTSKEVLLDAINPITAFSFKTVKGWGVDLNLTTDAHQTASAKGGGDVGAGAANADGITINDGKPVSIGAGEKLRVTMKAEFIDGFKMSDLPYVTGVEPRFQNLPSQLNQFDTLNLKDMTCLNLAKGQATKYYISPTTYDAMVFFQQYKCAAGEYLQAPELGCVGVMNMSPYGVPCAGSGTGNFPPVVSRGPGEISAVLRVDGHRNAVFMKVTVGSYNGVNGLMPASGLTADGEFWVDIEMGDGNPGNYAIDIGLGGVLSPVMSWKMPSRVKFIEVVQEPRIAGGLPGSDGELVDVGERIAVQPVVLLLDHERKPVQGYRAFMSWTTETGAEAPAASDIPSIYADKNLRFIHQHAAALDYRVSAPSNATGHATFGEIAFLDALTGCYFM